MRMASAKQALFLRRGGAGAIKCRDMWADEHRLRASTADNAGSGTIFRQKLHFSTSKERPHEQQDSYNLPARRCFGTADCRLRRRRGQGSVSYTHLTLPTSD